jgi:hypothetical protein
MEFGAESISAVGPKRLLTTVGSPLPLASACSPPPFALSLSKGQAELVLPIALSLSKGAFVPRAKGFDKLSPNGSLQTVNFAFGPNSDTCLTHCRPHQPPRSH